MDLVRVFSIYVIFSLFLNKYYCLGYKLVINKQTDYRTTEIENELRDYLPHLTVEADAPNGDIIFRTNRQPNNHFIRALRQLELMKIQNRIKNYGVQNSTMDDVFLKITNDANNENDFGATTVNMERLGLY